MKLSLEIKEAKKSLYSSYISFALLTLVLTSSFYFNPNWNFDWALQFYPILFQSLMLIVTPILLILNYKRLANFRFNSVDLFITLYIVYNVVRTTISFNNFEYLSENFYLFGFIGIYLSVRILSHNLHVQNNIILIIIFLGIVNISIGILQFIKVLPLAGINFTMTGAFFNPGPYAGYLASIAPLVLLLSLGTTSRRIWVIRILLLLLISAAIVISGSRAGIVSILASSTCLLFFFFTRKWTIKNRLTFLAVCFILFLFCLYLLYNVRPASADGRLLIWKVSTVMIEEQPLWGRGMGSFNSEYNLFQANFLCSPLATTYERSLAGNIHGPFNEYIRIAVESGVLGLGIFFAIIAALSSYIIKPGVSSQFIILYSSIFGFLVFAFFSYPFQVAANHLLFYVLIAVASSALQKKTSSLQYKATNRVGFIVVSTIQFILFIQATNVFNSIIKWESANKSFPYNAHYSLETLASIEPVLRNKPQFLYNYASQMAEFGYFGKALSTFQQLNSRHHNIYIYSQMGRIYQLLGNIENAENYFNVASCMRPHTLHPQLLLFNLYNETGQKGKAINRAKMILNTPVKIQTADAEKIRNDMHNFLFEKSLN